MQNFSEFNLPQELQNTLAKMNFTTPTPIQSQAIPIALEGSDILGSAQTGTGKTAAFLLPIITKLMQSENETALILTPTRELAKQIFDFANLLLERNKIRAALLIGGAPIFLQLRQLSMGARLIIGTPGRVNDHIGRNEMLLKNTKFLVLDETDLMLDMGFSEQINDILQYMPPKRQTLLFSATLSDPILKLSEKYLTNPQRIAIGKVSNVATNIIEEIVYTTREEKYDELVKALDNKTGSIIVFVKTKMDAEHVAKKLQKEKHKVDFLHGGLRQSRRDRVTKLFRSKGFRVLIATDVAARGFDIPHIEHVINYDMPETHEDYVHRIGRTARAAASGHALSLITSKHRVNNIKEFFDLNKGRPMRSGGSSRSRGGSSFRGGNSGGYRDGGRSSGRSRFGSSSSSYADRAPREHSSRGESSAPRRDYAPRSESSAPRREYAARSESSARSDYSAPRREYVPREQAPRFGGSDSAAPRSRQRGFGNDTNSFARSESRAPYAGGASREGSRSRFGGSGSSTGGFSDRAPRVSEYRGESRGEGRRFNNDGGSTGGYRGGSSAGNSAGSSFRKFNRSKD